ncbi:hypothetical protein BFW01_g1691 [Lasiodiplodia theobromae]|nr:hypothetical protein BFW01_g1691 [Lasiodiplodia theobromae]
MLFHYDPVIDWGISLLSKAPQHPDIAGQVADRPSSTVRGSTPRFPEEPPSSMQETIQRAMAVVKESSLLIPLFPAVEAHFRRTKSTIRVYKERGVVRHAESSSTMVDSSESGGFDKESIRIGSPTDDAVDLRSRGYQVTVYGVGSRQPSEDVDQLRRESASRQVPPPLPPPLPSWSFGGPPSSPPMFPLASSGRQEKAEIPETLQSDTQSPQVTIPSSGEDRPQEPTIPTTHLTVSQSEAHRSLRIGTQTPGTFEYSDYAALPTLEHQLVTYVTADDKEAFSQPGARSDADAAASATAAAQKCASQLQASPEL